MIERTTFSVMFFIKKTKLLKDGSAPLYLRITINGKRKDTSIKRSIDISFWDSKRYKHSGRIKEAAELNNYLDSIRGQLYSYHQQLQEKQNDITAQKLMNLFLGIDERKWMLFDLFEQHNDQIESLIGVDYSPATLTKF